MTMKHTKLSSVEDILRAYKEGQITADKIRMYSNQKANLSLERRIIYRLAFNLIKIDQLQDENLSLYKTLEENKE